MVFLQKNAPPRKKPEPRKPGDATHPPLSAAGNRHIDGGDGISRMTAFLAEAGCTLCTASSPLPFILNDACAFQRRLENVLSSSQAHDDALSAFVSGFSSYLQDPLNLRRVLMHSASCRDSLVRILLLVPPLQLPLQNLLLGKLPDYVHSDCGSLNDDVARLIVNQFRWLDFLVDPRAFSENLLQVLSICPVSLKKEIIGSLPEIIGDQNHDEVISTLQQMLQEDSELLVPVLDSFSNLNLDNQKQEQVATIGLSCIRTASAEHLPHLLRFLLLSAKPGNTKRIISQIREHVRFEGTTDSRASKNKKLKGKSSVANAEALVYEALRSGLRFNNITCEAILKELKYIDKARDHKVLDLWLLILIFANGGSLQRRTVKVIKKKIIDGSLRETLFCQCINGNRELVQDCFSSFVLIGEFLLTCKEQNAREFGIYIYATLFEEFPDPFSRQQILGSLVMHIGSGINFEVNSALETLILLSSKYSQELISNSSHIYGILDYLEEFSEGNLHKVYELFSHLALSARFASLDGSGIANELLMIIRKQVANPDWRYKRMGIIGTLKVVSSLGDRNALSCMSASQKTNCEEALDLLRIALDSCKASPLLLILLYDELGGLLGCTSFQPPIMQWMSKLVAEFESAFIYDLEGGQLSSKIEKSSDLEGELWMSLDGNLSPICLNILPLLSSSEWKSANLQFLPAKFLLLSIVEGLTNHGSLGGIDALLGCPLYLPSAKYFEGSFWKSLSEKQKQTVCLSLYYAINWIRELLNAFSTQISSKVDYISQVMREETTSKLLLRLRNLVFLENILNACLKLYPLSLPELNCSKPATAFFGKCEKMHSECPNRKRMVSECFDHSKKRHKTGSANRASDLDGDPRQPTILEVLRKSDVAISQQVSKDFSSISAQGDSVEKECSIDVLDLMEMCSEPLVLDVQRHKFRPLHVNSLSILSLTEKRESCCPDSAAELPLHLYLLRDFHSKLDWLSHPSKHLVASSTKGYKAPHGFSNMSVTEFLKKIRSLFPYLRKHLDISICVIKEGSETCQDHWGVKSVSAGNPGIAQIRRSTSSVALSVCNEILCCFSKILSLQDIYFQLNIPILKDLLDAFQTSGTMDDILSCSLPSLSSGTIDYSFYSAYTFFDSLVDIACSSSFSLASEVLVALQSLVNSIQMFIAKLSEGDQRNSVRFAKEILPSLRNRLGASARRLLAYNWDCQDHDSGWRSTGEILQKILHTHLTNTEPVHCLLSELACTILPQVPSCKTKNRQDSVGGLTTLCPATLGTWYRELQEENLVMLNKLLKELAVLQKSKTINKEAVEVLLGQLRVSVDVVVSLINLCRTHDKVNIQAMAVKYGGKFVDSFQRAFNFLQIHFKMHNVIIIQMVKELQKATRTIQTLCSEAKVSKRIMITSKIPCTKRSMERFLFNVKALFHSTSNGCSFWMGNLKHKDLSGQVVNSQAYDNSECSDNGQETLNPMEAVVEDVASSSQGSQEP